MRTISEDALRRRKSETLHNSKLRESAQRGNCIINVKGRSPLHSHRSASSATVLPRGALALPARWDNDNGIRTRMSCDSERKVSYNYRVAERQGGEQGGPAAKTDEQFMTCRFCVAFNIFFAVVPAHL